MSLRIAYVIGGVEDTKLDYLIDAGKHPGVEYKLFLSRNDADPLTIADIASARALSTRFWRALDRPQLALAALAHEQAIKYDAIVTSGEDIGVPLALSTLLDTVSVPIYIITHGSYFGSRKFQFVAALLRRSSNVHFLCLAESLCSALVQEFRIPEARVHNTSYGVDINFFAPAPAAPSDRPLIASAGVAYRDYRTLVAASDGLGADVRIAADSAWFPHAVDIDDDQLPPYVEARSYGDYLGLRSLYASASVVVVPLYPASHACGFAVIAEAMAMGKCVIASETKSKCDFLIDGKNGFYVPPKDTRALRDKLAFVLANPGVATDIGAAARKRMEDEYSVDAYCRRLESVVLG